MARSDCGFKSECVTCGTVLLVGHDRYEVFQVAYDHKDENPEHQVFVSSGNVILAGEE